MLLHLNRTHQIADATVGALAINGEFFCYTLEDVQRVQKVPAKTAVPAGEYSVVTTYSPRFRQDMPLLLNVPNFEGVRIHAGNHADNTEGCILVAYDWDKFSPVITRSRPAYNTLLAKLRTLPRAQPATMRITNAIEGLPGIPVSPA